MSSQLHMSFLKCSAICFVCSMYSILYVLTKILKRFSFSGANFKCYSSVVPLLKRSIFIWSVHFFNRRSAIHAEAPEFVEMSTEQEILVTGIKVVDLLAPYAKGGKIGR